jgi:hypothetical protein
MSKNVIIEPVFNRSEVAQILNISILTVFNREKNREVSLSQKRFKSL